MELSRIASMRILRRNDDQAQRRRYAREADEMMTISAVLDPARFKVGAAVERYSAFKHDDERRLVRILVVDDDLAMRERVVNYFRAYDIRAVGVAVRRDMAWHLATDNTSLVLLDLPLGHDNGLDLLREIRLRSDVPVIIIAGDRTEEFDRVVGLDLGADDYITKPFGLRELLARVRAVLRREASSLARRDPAGGRYRFGGWLLNRRHRRLTDPAGAPVYLTKGEYALLVAFLDAPQRPLSRGHLLQATRVHEDVFDRSIDVQILRLRRKLEADSSAPQILQTERGVGYVFTLPVERAG